MRRTDWLSHRRALAPVLTVFLYGAVALSSAQTASAPAGETATQSLWTIVWAGMSWPAFFIIAGSIALIALIVEHFITTRQVTIAPPTQLTTARQLIEKRQFRECVEHLRKSQTFFARSMSAALEHARHGFDAMHEAAVEKSSQLSSQMFRKVEYMNILGNLGPLMGLLGTVLGMIFAFGELGAGGDAGAGAGGLARGISLALVNTLLGLMLAIIGLGFYGVCRNRVDSLTIQATVEVLNLLEYFRPVPQSPAPATTAKAPVAVAAAAPRPIVTPLSPMAPVENE